MSQLDRKRPYGQTYGPVGHAYEQDGKLFNHEGQEIVTAVQGKAEAGGNDTDPVPGISTLSVAKATAELPKLTVAQLAELKAMEEAKEVPRKGLLSAIEFELASRAPADDQLANQLNG